MRVAVLLLLPSQVAVDMRDVNALKAAMKNAGLREEWVSV